MTIDCDWRVSTESGEYRLSGAGTRVCGSVVMAAECDWRRRLFGEQLLRPAPDPGPSLCPVDVLAPPDTHPEVLALYFRALSDSDDCPLTDALKQLYASVSPRLQVSYHNL